MEWPPENAGVYMKPSILRVTILVAIVGTQGCVRLTRNSPPDLLPRMPLTSEPPTDDNRPLPEGYARKLVHGKENPTLLIARDGTSCTVSKKKFDSTRIGAPVWCSWIDRNR